MPSAANVHRHAVLNGVERRLFDGLFEALLHDVSAHVTRAFLRHAAHRAAGGRGIAGGALVPMLATLLGPRDRYLADFLTSAGLARRHAEFVRLAARLVVDTYAGGRAGASADALVRAVYAEAASALSARHQP